MKTLLTLLFFGMFSVLSFADQPRVLSLEDRISYSLGYELGAKFERQKRDIDDAAFIEGLNDALNAMLPAIPEDEMVARVNEATARSLTGERQRKKRSGESYRGEGRVFLEANAAKEGVNLLPSGLQYQVIRAGTGRIPGPDDQVAVHYRGTLLDGSEFYNTRRRDGKPETFYVGAVIRGMEEALQLMKEGARWQLFVPADLAFGERGALADRALIYDLELVEIVPSR